MPNIRMDEAESALWHEVGTRGGAFRTAMRGRAVDLVAEQGWRVEIVDFNGATVADVRGAETNQHDRDAGDSRSHR